MYKPNKRILKKEKKKNGEGSAPPSTYCKTII
jgi:hypothetical protein